MSLKNYAESTFGRSIIPGELILHGVLISRGAYFAGSIFSETDFGEHISEELFSWSPFM